MSNRHLLCERSGIMDINWKLEADTFRNLFDGSLPHDFIGLLVMLVLVFPQTIVIGPPASTLLLIMPSKQDTNMFGRGRHYLPFTTETPFRIKVLRIVPIWLAVNFLVNCMATAIITSNAHDYVVTVVALVVGFIGFAKLFVELAMFDIDDVLPSPVLTVLSYVALFYASFIVTGALALGLLAFVSLNLIHLQGSALRLFLTVAFTLSIVVGLFVAVLSVKND